jgi:hypothetical protein
VDRTDRKRCTDRGRDGAEGEIDKFRDTDNRNGAWMDYWIAPDW